MMMATKQHFSLLIPAALAATMFCTTVSAQEPNGSGDGSPPEAAPEWADSASDESPTAPDQAAEQVTAPVDAGLELRCSDGTPQAQRACEDYNAALSIYEGELRDYRTTMNDIVRVEYIRRRGMVQNYYDDNIEAQREEESAQRLAAIEAFERFLRRYPSNERYTPDVMFRLAELYYEKSETEHLVDLREYDRQYDLFDLGQAEEPDPPDKDFTNTIRLFEQLLARFPDYRQKDGVYYLLAVCYDEMGEFDEGIAYFQRLVAEVPESQFAQEVYLRIGEYHFEDQQFALSLAAYTRAESYGESRWYDKILFKMGWSNYLLANFNLGIEQFQGLLEYYDQTGIDAGQGVREEALTYVAISIAEEDWDGDGNEDADFVMPRVLNFLGEDTAYNDEALDQLAGILLEYGRTEQAIDVLQYAMTRDECAPENLSRTELMITAYEARRMNELALNTQRDLGATFGPGTPWYQCQEREGNTEAMAQAERVAKESLIDSAARYYLRAQATSARASTTTDAEERGLLEQAAMEEYAFAARIYEDLLEQYPNEPEAYESQMYYAQTLFRSMQFLPAAGAFGAVRDSDQSAEFREDAAAGAIQAYEYELEREIDGYRLEGRAWPAYGGENVWNPEEATADNSDAPRGAPADEPIPDLSIAWAGAIDRYLDLGLNAEDDPNTRIRLAFQAGKLFYDYRHYDDARTRFTSILEECKEQIETGYAAGFLLETYRATGDTDGFLEISERMSTQYSACITDDLRDAIASDVNRIGMGMMAQRAEELFATGDFEGAAQEYVRLANEYSDNEETAPLGLFNAGLIYEQQLQKFELAGRQFDRIVNDYGGSDYVDDALVRIAVNSKRFFDFDRAIETYLVLHDMGWEDPEQRFAPPLVDAAELLRASGRFEEAAAAYLEFIGDNPDDPRAPALLYQAGVMYDEIGDDDEMRDVFSDFRRNYGQGYSELIDIDAAVIDTFRRSMVAHQESGDNRNAGRAADNMLEEFAVRLPQDDRSKYAAAELIYSDVLISYEEWDDIDLGETVADQQEGLRDRMEGIDPLLIEFNTVIDDFGSADWTVCALYRQGRIFQRMADLLYSLPVPDFGGNIDAEDEYIILIEDFATQYE
ncbi:MAG: tetratricopeptide (TPR) repeat protein, partial [Flavobacteriales bacterium]